MSSNPYAEINILMQRQMDMCFQIQIPLVHAWDCELGTAETNNSQRRLITWSS